MDIYIDNSLELKKKLEETKNIKEPVIFRFKEGEYEICESINIERDNVIFSGEKGKTVIKGSKKIMLSECEKDGNIVKIDLKKHGIKNTSSFGLGPFREFWRVEIPKPHMTDEGQGIQLYYNGKEMKLSRYPSEGYTKIREAS